MPGQSKEISEHSGLTRRHFLILAGRAASSSILLLANPNFGFAQESSDGKGDSKSPSSIEDRKKQITIAFSIDKYPERDPSLFSSAEDKIKQLYAMGMAYPGSLLTESTQFFIDNSSFPKNRLATFSDAVHSTFGLIATPSTKTGNMGPTKKPFDIVINPRVLDSAFDISAYGRVSPDLDIKPTREDLVQNISYNHGLIKYLIEGVANLLKQGIVETSVLRKAILDRQFYLQVHRTALIDMFTAALDLEHYHDLGNDSPEFVSQVEGFRRISGMSRDKQLLFTSTLG